MTATPLWKLLDARRDANEEVAWDRRHRYAWADFSGRVSALASRVADAPAGSRWLLDVTDAYGFAVGLFALAGAGAHAVVPPNRQPETLRELAAGCGGAIAADPAAHAAGPVLDPAATPPDPEPKPLTLDPEAPLVSLFTSGTTGQAREVTKTLGQLDEVAVLDRVFGGELLAGARLVATAPQQHLYGLLFRVLWPLAAGRPFHTETTLHAEELLGQLGGCDRSVLIGTPAHLRLLAARGGLAALRGRLVRVFSSGGPLDPETAAALRAELGASPVEVFGSTETGGVAHRQQRADGRAEPWQPLPLVSVRRDEASGRLVVRSPFVSVGAPAEDGTREFRLGDLAVLRDDGCFELRGRADRVVKVGEKRLALPDMESRMAEHPWVAEAALLVVEQGRQQRVGAVVVSSRQGAEALAQQGRRSVARTLSDHLAPRWDRVLLPRLWRFVPALPRDERGKTPHAELRALFAEPTEGRPHEPVVLEERVDGASAERLLIVPTDLAQLEGHFEGVPIVAGVVQLGWAMETARALLGAPPAISAIEALKFREILRPCDRVRVRVELSEQRDRLYFRLSDGDREFASGRCALESS